MKKASTAIIISILLVLIPSTALAGDAITVTIDGQVIHFPDQPPIIVEGRTLVPVRGVFEALGWDVDWHEDTQSALLSHGHVNISIKIGEPTFSVFVYNPESPFPGHGAIGVLDVPAQIIGGRTMLPLRAVLESVGYSLDWDDVTRTVLISSPVRPLTFSIEEFDGPSPAALELIYETDFNRYYLSSIRSASIMLTFEDGTRMSLKEALDLQKVTMVDLLFNGLEVIVM